MSQAESQLCLDIIAADFGLAVAKVAKDLLMHGRQSLQQLTQRKQRNRKALAILVHHYLVSLSDWKLGGRQVIFYEFNVRNCMLRLRYPYYIYLTGSQLGAICSKLVQLLLCEGKLSCAEMLERSGLDKNECFLAIKQLIEHRFIIITDGEDLETTKDLYMKMEDHERNIAGMPLTAAENKRLKLKLNAVESKATALGASGRTTVDYQSSTEMFQVILF